MSFEAKVTDCGARVARLLAADVRAFVAWLSSHHGSFDLEEIPLTR